MIPARLRSPMESVKTKRPKSAMRTLAVEAGKGNKSTDHYGGHQWKRERYIVQAPAHKTQAQTFHDDGKEETEENYGSHLHGTWKPLSPRHHRGIESDIS